LSVLGYVARTRERGHLMASRPSLYFQWPRFFTFNQPRSPGLYRPPSGFATSPSRSWSWATVQSGWPSLNDGVVIQRAEEVEVLAGLLRFQLEGGFKPALSRTQRYPCDHCVRGVSHPPLHIELGEAP
jgi:hypothetical protein